MLFITLMTTFLKSACNVVLWRIAINIYNAKQKHAKKVFPVYEIRPHCFQEPALARVYDCRDELLSNHQDVACGMLKQWRRQLLLYALYLRLFIVFITKYK